jgi:hypothetical protein
VSGYAWQETIPALRTLFEGLRSYDRAPPTILSQDIPLSKEETNRRFTMWAEHAALEESRAALAGAILEQAHRAITMLSNKVEVNEAYAEKYHLKTDDQKRFCIGPERCGVPIGLIVYAGRNQHAHWEEGDLRQVSKAVFAELEAHFARVQMFDTVFTIGLVRWSASHYILDLVLKWSEFENYRDDINVLLANTHRCRTSETRAR